MKKAIAIVGILVLALSSALADEKEAKEILEKAIKAHGGEKTLSKFGRSKRTLSGKHAVQGKEKPFTSDETRDLPDRLRVEVDLNKGELKTLVVLDGDKGYKSFNNGPADSVAKPRLAEFQEELYVDMLISLLPLRKSDYALKSAQKTKVGTEAAVGLKVTAKDKPEVTMYFSEKSGLLLRVSWRGSLAGLAVDKERTYSAHKAFDGVTVGTKEEFRINGNKDTEYTVTALSFPAKHDVKTFTRP